MRDRWLKYVSGGRDTLGILSNTRGIPNVAEIDALAKAAECCSSSKAFWHQIVAARHHSVS
jgi:hypothetical protein